MTRSPAARAAARRLWSRRGRGRAPPDPDPVASFPAGKAEANRASSRPEDRTRRSEGPKDHHGAGALGGQHRPARPRVEQAVRRARVDTLVAKPLLNQPTRLPIEAQRRLDGRRILRGRGRIAVLRFHNRDTRREHYQHGNDKEPSVPHRYIPRAFRRHPRTASILAQQSLLSAAPLRQAADVSARRTGLSIGRPARTSSSESSPKIKPTSFLGYAFVPRIRDLPSKRLYVFERAGVPKHLRPLVGGKVNVELIDRNWADILRVAATLAAGTMRPSQILRKLAAYPRQNELAAALREVGRIERSLFMIDWTTDPDMRRRAQVGLNKGEAHHALKRAINFHQRGELRDRTGEGQHYRVAGLNLLAAIIICWNTLKLGEAVFARRNAGLEIPAEFLATSRRADGNTST